MPSELRPTQLLDNARRRRDEALADLHPPAWQPPYLPSAVEGAKPFLGRIFAVNRKTQLCSVDPIKPSTDPSRMGQDGGANLGMPGGSNVWTVLEYPDFFNVAQRKLGVWTGGWTGAMPGTPVICFKMPNCRRWMILQALNLTGMPNDTYEGQPYDPEDRFAEPCAPAAVDPTIITQLPPGGICQACADPDPIMHGGCDEPVTPGAEDFGEFESDLMYPRVEDPPP